MRMRRRKLTPRRSKAVFRKGARVKPVNYRRTPMRGGIRF